MISLTIAISTYNRVENLKKYLLKNLQTINRFNKKIKSNKIHVHVHDNTSLDDTYNFCQSIDCSNFSYARNAENVGILGNPIKIAELIDSDYIWVIGDDDIIVYEQLEWIVYAIKFNPDLLYFNYRPRKNSSVFSYYPGVFERDSKKLYKLSDIYSYSKNYFTAHYAMCMKKELALKVFGYYSGGEYFSNLNNTIPTTDYLLNNGMDLNVMVSQEPAVVAMQEVSWISHAAKWNLVILPEVHDIAKNVCRNNDFIEEINYWKFEHLPALLKALNLIFINNPLNKDDTNKLPHILSIYNKQLIDANIYDLTKKIINHVIH